MRILNTPLLIHRQKLDVILSVLSDRIGIVTPATALPYTGAFDQISNGQESGIYRIDRIAVIPVTGSLVNRALGVEAISGLTSYGEIRRNLDSALADTNVDGIVLDIDSPGGEAGGAFDLADHIFSIRKNKPIWAVANDQAFSAAYTIASSCERIFVTRTAGVGSIGVIALHVDQSQKDAQDGYRYTPVYAGQHKNDFNPHAPLSPSAQAALQSEVDRLQNLFVATVARNRSLSEDAVGATEAGLFFGDNALTVRLADAVGTLNDAVLQLSDVIRVKRAATLSPRSTQSGSHSAASSSPLLLTTHQENPTMDTPTPAASKSDAAPAPSSANPTVDAAANSGAQALAIADLCMLAGMPERTADLLKRGVNIDDARRELLAAKAAAGSEEIHSRLAPSSNSATAPSLDQNPVVKAARARAATTRAEA
jgi:signal peptide peptidase SppA